jgi:hypothetical protein
MVPTTIRGEHESYDVEGVSKRVCRDVTVVLHDTEWCFPTGFRVGDGAAREDVFPLEAVGPAVPKPQAETGRFSRDAGFFRGQVGDWEECVLHIPSQNRNPGRPPRRKPPS